MKRLISFALSFAVAFAPGSMYAAEAKKSADAMEESLKIYNKYRHSKSEWIAHYFKGTAQESSVRDAMKDLPEKMPAVQKVGKRYQMMVQNQLVTWEAVDWAEGLFLINGKAFRFDRRALFIENLERLETMFPAKTSYSPLYRLLVPEAQAWFGLVGGAIALLIIWGAYKLSGSDGPKERFDQAIGKAEGLCKEGPGSLSGGDRQSLQDRVPKITEILTGTRCLTDDLEQLGIRVRPSYFKSLCTRLQAIKDCLEDPKNVKKAQELAQEIDKAHIAHQEIQRLAEVEARKNRQKQNADAN